MTYLIHKHKFFLKTGFWLRMLHTLLAAFILGACAQRSYHWEYQSELYPSGMVKSESLLRSDGLKDGRHVSYYENGIIQRMVQYSEGAPNGMDVWFFKNGKVFKISSYSNGEQNGPQLEYYNSGLLHRKSNYKTGQLDGKYFRYYKNGNIEYVGYYHDGKPSGEHLVFNEDGSYKSGHHQSFYATGELQFEGNVVQGRPNGKYIFYWKNGRKSLEVEFKHGKLHGDYKFFDENEDLEPYQWVFRYGDFIRKEPVPALQN